MRLFLAAQFLKATIFGSIAWPAQSNLLARKKSQQLAVGPAFFQEVHETPLSASSCDTSLSDPICFAGGQHALLPNSVPRGLIGHWDFNAEAATDSSGNGNHGATLLVHGPSPAGSGHSGVFTKNFMMVPNSPLLQNAKDFTYSFWVYLADDRTGPAATAGMSQTWCPLIRKGIHETQTQQFANAPGLLFNHRTGRLRAEVTTTVKSMQNNVKDGESVDSNARLMSNRWLHIAIVHHSSRRSLLLYVNGILDTALHTQGEIVTNEYPLYVGGDPFTGDQCDFTVYIDELRVFSHAVPPHQLEAEAAPALGGVDPSYVRLGCLSCSLQEAAARCPKNRHVCTSVELHTGGYQVARSLGWLSAGTHVWTHAAVVKGAAAQIGAQVAGNPGSPNGLCLCCDGPP